MILNYLKLKSPAQLAKLVLIPVLGLVLYKQLMPAAETSSDVAGTSTPTRVSRARVAGMPATAQASWPTMSLPQITAYNPFTLPESLQDPELIKAKLTKAAAAHVPIASDSSNTETSAEPVRREIHIDQLQAIYQSPRGRVVLINNQSYKVGDKLPDGVLIVAINPESIVVQSLESDKQKL